MKKIITILLIPVISAHISYGQKENASIRNGNKLYRQSNFGQSVAEYKKAVTASPGNSVANYNLGNAEFRTNQLTEAVDSYDASIKKSDEKSVKEKSFYNKGVAYSKQQNLKESIEAWKSALKLDPNDVEARENLQKALLEQKKQQEKQDQKKNEEEKKNDKKKQEKDQQQQDKQQPEQSRLSKKQVEQLLKALAQKEKEVQQKMQSKNSSSSRQDKDW